MKKNKITFIKVVSTLSIMLLITISAYVIMAIITHFSLNYLAENYRFSQSLISVFDTETAIFNFFFVFVIMCVTTVLTAISVKIAKEEMY